MALRRTFLGAALASATLLASTITGPTISPSTITFSSRDPDVTPVNGSSSATVQWTMSGNKSGNWALAVQAASSTLSGCSAVPVGAVQFRCTAWSATKGTGSCASGTIPLSTTSQTVASGSQEGDPGTHTVTVAFTFTDAWKYPASSSCSAQLTYTITAQ
jgi:hypothetical protein